MEKLIGRSADLYLNLPADEQIDIRNGLIGRHFIVTAASDRNFQHTLVAKEIHV